MSWPTQVCNVKAALSTIVLSKALPLFVYTYFIVCSTASSGLVHSLALVEDSVEGSIQSSSDNR